ncbi:M48 family metalloprotease [Propylenella binzhouense]|uniref:M48 family peptidase n=1 Tax=Propylenella binzhouense TaxID=2555902 RepID=A0A964WV21_9HYPH|nr:M48 family metalloprotease [Propylenella binzhouense]MYZ49686.1 M48 family peptidase [Propylenella binzhouense]
MTRRAALLARLPSSLLPRPPQGVARRAAAAALAGTIALAPAAAPAQQRPLPVIRDAEIEQLLRDYAAPIFKAAGIGSRGAEIVILKDPDFNAFVASGSRIFINTGTLLQAKTPNEVIGVLAHETGHLAGGHLQNLRDEMAHAATIGMLGALLGAGAMVAGAGAGSTEGAQMGAAAAMIAPSIVERSVLSYRRAQEIAADRAALSYLDATGQSARGMIDTFRTFADQQLFAKQYADPYAQSHPMASDRIAQLETAAGKSRYWNASDPPALLARHAMMRAKLSGFIESPGMVARRYPRSDTSLAAEYARAILAYRTGSPAKAVKQIDALIARAPSDPYFHELKGQALLESGRAREAIAPLRQAASLAPKPGLIRIMLGHALLQTGDPALLDQAVGSLQAGLRDEPLASEGYRHLATALAKEGRIAEAELATARGLLIEGSVSSAQAYAKRAQAKLKRGTPAWLQADDILAYKNPKSR